MDRQTLQRLIAVILVGIVLLWGIYTYLYKPKLRDIYKSKNELQMIETEIRTTFPAEKILIKGREFDSIKKEIEQVEKRLPNEENIISVIEKLTSQKGIDYILVEPKGAVPEDKYSRLPLKLKLSCSFLDFDAFLQRIENLPMIIRIDEFDIYRTEKTDNIEVSTTLSIFFTPSNIVESIGSKSHKYIYDPFYPELVVKPLPKAGTPQKPAVPHLNGIWLGKTTKAFINNQAVGVGEYIDGYKVLAISKDNVILIKNGVKYTLRSEGKE